LPVRNIYNRLDCYKALIALYNGYGQSKNRKEINTDTWIGISSIKDYK